MTTTRCRLLLAVLFPAFVACVGCNPFLLPLFLQGEAKEEPSLKRLALEDKKKEVKVAVIVSSQLDARQELRNVTRDLGRKTAEQLRLLATANEDKLVVIEPAKVERFLANHPDWKNMDPSDLASEMKTALKVNYVIDIEINSMSLYPRNCNHELLRGEADLHVVLLNANDSEDTGRDQDIHTQYPTAHAGGEQLVDSDTSVSEFRDKFLTSLGKKIAYCFCAHPKINQLDDSREGLGD